MKSTTIADVAHFLNDRDPEKFLVLFLGARTGGFFENEGLYDKIKGYTTKNFDNLNKQQKFHNCYEILGTKFSEKERDEAFSKSLGEKYDEKSGKYLADLFKANYFNAIVTTAIDLRLEDAFRRERVGERRDYQLIINKTNSLGFVVPDKQNLVFKVFGDIASKQYKTAGDELVVEDNLILRDFIEHLLNENDLLMVGYDADWDGALNRAFFKKGGSIVYVSETDLAEDSFIFRVMEARESSCLIGHAGGYKNFFRELYFELFEESKFAFQQIFQAQEMLNEKITLLKEEMSDLRGEVAFLRDEIKKLQ